MTLLLVEDDSALREGVAALLGLAGYEVIESGSAEEALTLLEAGPVDLIISDLDLPGRSGQWLLKEAARRALHPRERTMLLTARHDLLVPPGALKKPVSGWRLLGEVARRAPALRARSGATAQGLPVEKVTDPARLIPRSRGTVRER